MADYTNLEHDEVVALGRQLDVRVSSLRRLEGGMRNSRFALGTDVGPLVLSVLDSHDLASARVLADMTAALAAAGVPTPPPLASPGRGRVLVTRAGTPVMVRPHVEGEVFVTVPGRELDAAGRLHGRIHTLEAPVRLPPPRRRLPEGWRDRLRGCADARLVELAGRAEAIGRQLR
jgi:Ser/Thr protein kinase RdoA (MazF antagonist)